MAHDLEPFLFRAQRQGFQQLRQVVADRKRNRFELELAHLDLREVEDVVEDTQERIGRALGHAEILALLRRQRRVERELGHADDAVERRPNLMAHIRQELALGLVCLLSDVRRRHQLRGTLADLSIEVFGQRAQLRIQVFPLDQGVFELLI